MEVETSIVQNYSNEAAILIRTNSSETLKGSKMNELMENIRKYFNDRAQTSNVNSTIIHNDTSGTRTPFSSNIYN